jgi:hypothetical protein
MVHFTGRGSVWRALLVAGAVLMLSSSAHAQTIQLSSPQSQIGFHGGLSIDPEQLFAGVWWQTPELGGRFHLRPGIDGGFGDNLRVATINIDFIARFPLGASGWQLIQGGGPVIVLTRFDLEGFDSDTDVGAGFGYLFGFAHDSGFFGDFRLGSGRAPTLKLGVGWAIGF